MLFIPNCIFFSASVFQRHLFPLYGLGAVRCHDLHRLLTLWLNYLALGFLSAQKLAWETRASEHVHASRESDLTDYPMAFIVAEESHTLI